MALPSVPKDPISALAASNPKDPYTLLIQGMEATRQAVLREERHYVFESLPSAAFTVADGASAALVVSASAAETPAQLTAWQDAQLDAHLRSSTHVLFACVCYGDKFF